MKLIRGSLAIAQLILDQVAAGTGDVLELGCGDGQLAYELGTKAARVLALDSDCHKIEKATAKYSTDRITFCVCDAESMDHVVKKQRFDYIVCVLSLHELNIPAVLSNMRYHLRTGGRIIIVDLYANRSSSFKATLLDQLCIGHFAERRALAQTVKDIGLGKVASFLIWRIQFASSWTGFRHMRQDYERGRPPSLSEWRSFFRENLPFGTERILLGSLFMYTWLNQ